MKIMTAESEIENSGSVATSRNGASAPAKNTKSVLVNPFGRSPEFLGNRFVYAVISQRAHGLSIGVNLNPDKCCNFDCAYCEVRRDVACRDNTVDLDVLSVELQNLLDLTFAKRLREFAYFHSVPQELLELKAVALSGEG